MQISENFEQFKRDYALFLVLDQHDGRVLMAHDGMIEEIDSFKIDNPHYSDREGRFSGRAGRVFMMMGNVLRPRDRSVAVEFMHTLRDRMQKLAHRNEVTQLFLFVPPRIKHAVWKVLPATMKTKIVATIEGNFNHASPFELIERAMVRMRHVPINQITPEERLMEEKGRIANRISARRQALGR